VEVLVAVLLEGDHVHFILLQRLCMRKSLNGK
jgi:hypothetical protein